MREDIRRWMVELRLREDQDLYAKAIPFYAYMTDLLPAMFLAWLEGASEEERDKLFELLSASKKSVRRQKALEFFGRYFKQKPEVDGSKEEKTKTKVQSKGSWDKFMDKYGGILSL